MVKKQVEAPESEPDSPVVATPAVEDDTAELPDLIAPESLAQASP